MFLTYKTYHNWVYAKEKVFFFFEKSILSLLLLAHPQGINIFYIKTGMKLVTIMYVLSEFNVFHPDFLESSILHVFLDLY